MTEVGVTDLSRLLHSKRNDRDAIVTSRTRRLRELFAVATHVESLPHDAFGITDALPPTQPERDFLQANDISQGHKFQQSTIPSRRQCSVEKLKQSLIKYNVVATEAPALVASPDQPPVEISPKPSTTLPAPKPSPTPQPVTITPQPILDTQRLVSNHQPSLTTTHAPSPAAIPQKVESTITVAAPDNASMRSPVLAAAEATPVRSTDKEQPAQRRPTHVSFPPGTKGSPSEAVVAVSERKVIVEDKIEDGPTNAPIAKQGKALSPIKVSADVPRSDAPSSPGSTAHSATTPGVHDASTDTSPENEGPSYVEVEESTKREEERDEGKEKGIHDREETASPPDNAKSAISAEDQLLQESIQSSEAEADAKAQATNGDLTEKAEQKSDALVTITVQPTKAEDQEDEESHETRAATAEIPDSQEDEPERMDVDNEHDTAPTKEAEPEVVSEPSEKEVPSMLTEPSAARERAVTRVSSGAMRARSVTEIVGGPVWQPSSSERVKEPENQLTPVTPTPHTPISRRHWSPSRKDKQKQGKPVVVFGKQIKGSEETAMVPSSGKTRGHLSDDYYTPLFIQGFAGSSSWMQPLEKMLYHANKTVTTSEAALAIQDHQACKVLRRVYHLQNTDKWSLRQPKRSAEPSRPPSHWDVVVQEMKWMRTDFRQERKWKRSVASLLANACADWVEASPEDRKLMQVLAHIPTKHEVSAGSDVGSDLENQPTPDLLHGDAESQNDDNLSESFPDTVSPSAIFAMQDDDVVFGLRQSAASDKLLDELPLYGAPLKVPAYDFTNQENDPDALWRRPALPLSKYVEGRMKLIDNEPTRKRSRYDYANEDSEDEDGDFISERPAKAARLDPESTEVALFDPEMKHIRDRIYAGHQFRPPTDHPMPSQGFYECRNPSQWTQSEDDELRSLVREYSYNWPLISSLLTKKSIYTSGAERRTPWECFERWIGLEGLPTDMQRTQYFRTYTGRIEAAQRTIHQFNIAAAQQAQAAAAASGTGNTPVMPMRRRQSVPLRVERRRNQKHLTILDAMRKLAKKRETALQKQQHQAAQQAANKKPTDPVQKPTKTPRDYSIMRHERDQALAERMTEFAKRQEAQRRVSANGSSSAEGNKLTSGPKAAMQARAQGPGAPSAGPPGVPSANGQQPPGTNGTTLANSQARVNAANQVAAAAQARAQVRMQPPNGMAGSGMQAPMNGNVQQAQINVNGAPQAQMNGQHPRMAMPGQQQPDANMMMRAQRLSEQQRMAAQMQQVQHHHHPQAHQQLPQQQQQHLNGNAAAPRPTSQHNSPPIVQNGMQNGAPANNFNQQAFMNNAQALMAQLGNNGANGHASPPANGLHMPAGSPDQRQQSSLPVELAARLSHLEQQYRGKNPNLTREQARGAATEHLARIMAAHRQNAMSAAAGGSPGIANTVGGTTSSPHQYAALLRQQQQQQAQAQAQAQQAQQAQHQAQQQQSPSLQPTPQLASSASPAAPSPLPPVANRQSSEGTPSAAQ